MDIAPPLPSHGYSSPHVKNTCKGHSPLLQVEFEQAADFLAIDDLLDFSNDDIGGPIEPCTSNATSSLSLSSGLQIEPSVLPPLEKQLSHLNQSCGFDSDSLCVPCDDLAELEWLSNFVEESFSSGNAPACLGWGSYAAVCDNKNAHREESFQTTSPVSVLESNAFPREKLCPAFSSSLDMSPVPGRARSKRCRTAVCFWNTRILSPEASESLLESSSTTYMPNQAISSESNMYNTYYDYEEDDSDDEDDGLYRRIHHKMKNSPPKVKNSSFKIKSSPKLFNPKPKKFKVDDATQTRKCLHCGTQKTPQWRAGPMGPKTLCNACGVRYKSGRLCEEYRPAASPTFIESVHSNSHRKVLEMRKQRLDMSGLESQKQKENSHRLRIGNSSGCAPKSSDDNSECNRENVGYSWGGVDREE